MSYLNRVWVAASVAVVSGHNDQGHKWISGIKSVHHGKRRFSSSSSAGDAADLRPFSTVTGSDIGEFIGSGGEKRKHSDDSLRQVMYLNCWGQG